VHGDQTPLPEPDDLDRLDDDTAYERTIVLLASVTDEILDAVREMDDAAVREPSACPGWSRGHVITHVARNADGLDNLLTWARTGVETPMYPSWDARNAGIEEGAGRSASDLESDLEASSEKLLEGLAALPVANRHVQVRSGSGHLAPAHDVLWWRVREVAYHHVDLRTGHRFADLPASVVRRGLSEAVDRLSRKEGAPGLRLEVTDVPGIGPWTTGDGALAVRGTAADLLGWLTGREDGAALDADGPLPALPPWG
jgi:maleylpyruvate isomerase